MAYPTKTRAEARKGVVHEEVMLCEMYTNVSSWAPGRRAIYTCPLNYPGDAKVTPFQARLFYEYLSAAPTPALYKAGLAILEAVSEAYQERATVAFEFIYDYEYKHLLFRMGPPSENHQNPANNISRTAEVYMYLDLREDGSARGNFYNWKNDSHSYVYGIDKITKRFLTQMSKLIPLPVAKAA